MDNIATYVKKGGSSRDVKKDEKTTDSSQITTPCHHILKVLRCRKSDTTDTDREKAGDQSKNEGYPVETKSPSRHGQNDANPPSVSTISNDPKEKKDAQPITASDTNDTRSSHLFRTLSYEHSGAQTDDVTAFDVVPKAMGRLYQAACEKFEYFWLKEDVFSQWYPSVFYVDGTRFGFAEQYMMYQKAVLAEDSVTAKQIMAASNPKKMKQLGRNVSNLSYPMWKSNCLHVVKQANVAKFSQNKHLKQNLFSTYPKILVEASPYDKVWGIGLPKYEPLAWNQSTWQGTNWLGFVLTEVRDELMYDDKIIVEKDKQVYIDRLLAE